MSAHTPGPWQLEPKQARGNWILGQGDFVALATMIEDDPDQEDANARLIAAAPDMLEALKETTLQLQYLADKFGKTGTGAQVLARVNAAIAKATGST